MLQSWALRVHFNLVFRHVFQDNEQLLMYKKTLDIADERQ
jgi:hypothetical protein